MITGQRVLVLISHFATLNGSILPVDWSHRSGSDCAHHPAFYVSYVVSDVVDVDLLFPNMQHPIISASARILYSNRPQLHLQFPVYRRDQKSLIRASHLPPLSYPPIHFVLDPLLLFPFLHHPPFRLLQFLDTPEVSIGVMHSSEAIHAL